MGKQNHFTLCDSVRHHPVEDENDQACSQSAN